MGALQLESPFDVSQRLVARGLVTPTQVAEARGVSERTGRLLEEILLDMGAMPDEELARFYCAEFGYPYLGEADLQRSPPTPEALSRLPSVMAHDALVVPLAYDEETRALDVLVAFPTNRSLLSMLQTYGPCERLCFFIAPRQTLRRAVEAHYGEGMGTHRPATGQHRARRMLLAEPDAHVRTLWREMLSRAGHQVSEAESLPSLSERLKTADFDVVLARYGPNWKMFAGIADTTGDSLEVRFAPDPRHEFFGEVVPYTAMRNFYFSSLRALISIFGRSHGVPADAILALPRLCRAVAEVLGLPPRAVDELQFAAYLAGIARALKQDPMAFAESVERGIESPFRVRRLLQACFGGSGTAAGPKPVGARILQVVLSFVEELKRRTGAKAETLAALRQKADPEDRLVVEALVGALRAEKVVGMGDEKVAGEVLLVASAGGDLVRSLDLAFKNRGFRTRTLMNGHAAEAELALAPPDLVVSETSMPGRDGYSLCAWAKSRLGIPTFLVGVDAQDAFSQVRAKAVGAEGFFPSPIDLDALLSRAQALMGAASQSRRQPPRCAGSLAQLSPRALFSLLTASRARAVVHLWSGDKSARVKASEGKLYLADERGDFVEGDLAELLGWNEGTFMAFDESPRAVGGTP